MRDVEYGAYFKHANLVSVKIISFLSETTNLKKDILVAPAVSVWMPSKVTPKDDCSE